MTNRSRSTLAIALGAVGVAAIAFGFFGQSQSNSKARVEALLGGSGTADKGLMWAAFGLGAVCLVGALIALLSRSTPVAVAPAALARGGTTTRTLRLCSDTGTGPRGRTRQPTSSRVTFVRVARALDRTNNTACAHIPRNERDPWTL